MDLPCLTLPSVSAITQLLLSAHKKATISLGSQRPCPLPAHGDIVASPFLCETVSRRRTAILEPTSTECLQHLPNPTRSLTRSQPSPCATWQHHNLVLSGVGHTSITSAAALHCALAPIARPQQLPTPTNYLPALTYVQHPLPALGNVATPPCWHTRLRLPQHCNLDNSSNCIASSIADPNPVSPLTPCHNRCRIALRPSPNCMASTVANPNQLSTRPDQCPTSATSTWRYCNPTLLAHTVTVAAALQP